MYVYVCTCHCVCVCETMKETHASTMLTMAELYWSLSAVPGETKNKTACTGGRIGSHYPMLRSPPPPPIFPNHGVPVKRGAIVLGATSTSHNLCFSKFCSRKEARNFSSESNPSKGAHGHEAMCLTKNKGTGKAGPASIPVVTGNCLYRSHRERMLAYQVSNSGFASCARKEQENIVNAGRR